MFAVNEGKKAHPARDRPFVKTRMNLLLSQPVAALRQKSDAADAPAGHC